MSLISDRDSALQFLLGRVNYERTTNVPYQTSEFKLDRMRRLMALLGDPHLSLKAVHVAGTKGKGSTAAMVARVLQRAGYRTGLYTSPHLEAIEERIAVDGQNCSQGEFVQLAAELQIAVEKLEDEFRRSGDGRTGPTFFEVTTAMAFLHFARRGIAAAVLEVGLGGRLDSTNICLPQVCILTSISLDHTKQLGNTLAAIAAEKAGIIKPGVPVVSGVVQPEPRQVVEQTAAAQHSRLYQRGRDFHFEHFPAAPTAGALEMGRMAYREPGSAIWPELGDVSLGMFGEHQAANAATATCALARLCERGWHIEEQHLRAGLAAARCDARIEVLAEQPTVICDVAHNVASIAALLTVLKQRFLASRRILIFASSKDKDTRGMLRLALPEFEHIILTKYIHNPRAVEPQEMEVVAREELATLSPSRSPHLHVAPNPEAAYGQARQLAAPADLICIAGSFFLAAELHPLVAAGKLAPLAAR